MSSLLALFAHALPIWHAGNLSTNCSYFLSPPFVLPAPVSSFTSLPLLFTAMRSPQVSPVGTRQSKLFNAATLYLNGVPLTAGPGHATLDSTQPVRLLDLVGLPLLDPPSANVIAVSSCFFPTGAVSLTPHCLACSCWWPPLGAPTPHPPQCCPLAPHGRPWTQT